MIQRVIPWRRMLPFMRWWPRVDKATARADAWSGLTNAVVVLPQGVAFALLAGLPPEYGLYTAIVPAIIAALFGSSWHLISGPTLALSIMVFSTLAPLATPGSEMYISLALTLTLLAGLYQLGFGLARLGTLVNFVSPAVITGFTAAAAILVVTSQLRHVLGLEIPRGGSFLEVWYYALTHLGAVQPRVLAIAATSFVVAIGIRMVRPKWPYLLLAMLAGGLAGYGLNAAEHGVAVVGSLPSGVPQLSLPTLDFAILRDLAAPALAVALLGLIEAVSIGRAIALRSQQRIDGNQEFIGQGLSNIVGAFASCYASSGSFTRSGINYEAGARTPLSALFSAAFLMLILFGVGSLAAYLPTAAMGGMILLVAWNLIDRKYIREIWRSSYQDTTVLLVTFFTALLVDLAFAVLAGVLLSLVLFLNRAANPSVFSLAPDPNNPKRRFANLRRKHLTECPQLKIVRIDGHLFFGSVQPISETLGRLSEGSDARKHILIVCSNISYIDSAGAQMLVAEARRLERMGGGLYLCDVRLEQMAFLRRSGYAQAFGRDHIFSRKENAIAGIFERLEREICERCTARIFNECQRVPRRTDNIVPIET
ncbi:SulP family inorganic anion transporter [Halofilum ochraceum]|uniref:SulP family inorganic anion transporter n=1 Tax=Halofilum ochraceum TaxID=1611323 RepID=UPI000B00769E|nr:sulfate permease [Halofilum ochraceum]